MQHLSFQDKGPVTPSPLQLLAGPVTTVAPPDDWKGRRCPRPCEWCHEREQPPLTVSANSALSLQPRRRPNQLFICFWTVSPEVENLTGPNCGSASNNGETSTPDLAGPARSTNYLFRPIRWNLGSGITSRVPLRNLRLGTALKSCQTKQGSCTNGTSVVICHWIQGGRRISGLILNSGGTKWLLKTRWGIANTTDCVYLFIKWV